MIRRPNLPGSRAWPAVVVMVVALVVALVWSVGKWVWEVCAWLF